MIENTETGGVTRPTITELLGGTAPPALKANTTDLLPWPKSLKALKPIRCSNPFNVKRPGSKVWDGTIGYESDDTVIFIDPIYAVRAFVKICAAYRFEHGILTLLQWAERYAPTTDGNNPVEYANFIAKATNADPNENFMRLLFSPDKRAITAQPKDNWGTIPRWEWFAGAVCQMEVYRGYCLDPYTLQSGLALYNHDLIKG